MATVPHLTLVTKSNVGSPCCLRGFLWPNVSLSERCVPSLSANHVLNVCCFCVASGFCLVTPMCRPLFCGLLCLCCDFFLACWRASHNTALKTWGGCTHQSFHCVYICMHTHHMWGGAIHWTHRLPSILNDGNMFFDQFLTWENPVLRVFLVCVFFPQKRRFSRIFEKHPFAVMQSHMDWP